MQSGHTNHRGASRNIVTNALKAIGPNSGELDSAVYA